MYLNEWVFVVLDSKKLHYQIYSEDEPPPRKPRWVRTLLKAIVFGSKIYGFM